MPKQRKNAGRRPLTGSRWAIPFAFGMAFWIRNIPICPWRLGRNDRQGRSPGPVPGAMEPETLTSIHPIYKKRCAIEEMEWDEMASRARIGGRIPAARSPSNSPPKSCPVPSRQTIREIGSAPCSG